MSNEKKLAEMLRTISAAMVDAAPGDFMINEPVVRCRSYSVALRRTVHRLSELQRMPSSSHDEQTTDINYVVIASTAI